MAIFYIEMNWHVDGQIFVRKHIGGGGGLAFTEALVSV